MISLGFERCMADLCMFRLVVERELKLVQCAHVDDFFCFGEKKRCEEFGRQLNEFVPVKSLRELKWYSGCFS